MSDDYDFKLYRYTPSIPTAAVALSIFSILTIGHVFRMFTRRYWAGTPFVIGGCFQIAGYTARIFSHSSPTALGPYIVQSLLILLAPALFAASIYMSLGRLMRVTHGEDLALVPAAWQTRFFVAGDVGSFLLQMCGGGIQAAGTLELLHTGEKIILAGLWVQILFFGFFVVVAGVFHWRMARREKMVAAAAVAASERSVAGGGEVRWRRAMGMLYTVSGLILVRSIFRVIEYIQGNAGYLLRNEWTLYIFDALLMALTMVVFIIWYPRSLKPSKESGIALLES